MQTKQPRNDFKLKNPFFDRINKTFPSVGLIANLNETYYNHSYFHNSEDFLCAIIE